MVASRSLRVMLATALALVGVPAAAAIEPDRSGPAGAITAVSADAPAPREYSVTLITGDTVAVTYAPGEPPQVRVDGGDGGYDVRREGDDVYVVPASAMAALAADRIDEELFNVTGLVAQGYHDAARATIPVIAAYRARLRSHPAPPAGTTEVDTLASIHADALRVTKARADDAWRAFRNRLSAPESGTVKLWLDAKVRATLDQSVPLVGAPEAWASGLDGTGATVAVLDSGVDAEHPDLADAVVAMENFTTDASADDGSGHGTHVASTIAGTGAASDDANTGVAPGADLLVGKVLNNFGFGESSWIIAGMEWAAAQDADVVNLSIGQSEATGCDDPMAAAVNRLSASTDTLFVIAAGNLGGPSQTIPSPGCAASALTVGAVELDGSTAWFSSRGPVPVSHAVKPDIVAPGVGITAARAGGGRGDRAYIDMDGTSMATPHVAGAAAILAQQHPEWDGERIKAVLQSAVRPDAATSIYEQGAGFLDIANAVDTSLSGPSTVDFGTLAWPHPADDAVTRELEYHNTGAEDRTLTFTAAATGESGNALPSDAVELGVSELTVPAGGSAVLPVTVDPSAELDHGDYGAISVRVVASADDGQSVVTPVGAYVEPKQIDVTFRVVNRAGVAAANGSSLDVLDMDAIAAQRVFLSGKDVTLRLRAGTYSIATIVVTPQTGGFLPDSVALLAEPELRLTEDRVITLDARDADRVQLRTDRTADLHSGSVSYARTVGPWILNNTRLFGASVTGVYLGDTDRVRRGEFEVVEAWRLESPAGAEQPYVYDLVYPHERVPERPSHFADSDRLATVRAEYYTPGAPDDYVEYVDGWRPISETYVPVGDIDEVAAPGRLTHYMTADDDVPIRQAVVHPDGTRWTFAAPMYSTTEPREPRSRTTESWYETGLRPGVPSSALLGRYDSAGREQNVMWTNFSSWSDTEPGHYSWGGLTGPATSVELLADGESLGEHHWFGEGSWAVPAAAQDYELVYDLHRFERSFSTWRSPNVSETRWRFSSEDAPGSQPLPLLFPDYDLPVDLANQAPSIAYYPIRIRLEATPGYDPGRIDTAEVAVSYDEGGSWEPVHTRRIGQQLLAFVDNRPASGSAVSLRLDVTDDNGVGVTQTVNRLYRVK